MLKTKVLSVIGFIGGAISYMVGDWTGATVTLLIFMCVDYITGFMVGAFFKNSPKTDTGGLSSKIGFKGLAKKCLILMFLLIGYRLDLTLGTTYIKDGVCYAFIVNELVSIIENSGLMGLTVPSIISDSIDILKSKSNKNTTS